MKKNAMAFIAVILASCGPPTEAQNNQPNLPAEGPLTRQSGQYGVNRRVAIAKPDHHSRVIGYNRIAATFDTSLQIPMTGISDRTLAGEIPNKPTMYFGIRGPGRMWVPDDRLRRRINPGRWESRDQVEVDAGLEYDAREYVRGWRAFISVNSIQTNYLINGRPWRGQADSYKLTFHVDQEAIAHLTVEGGGETFTFPWNHSNTPRFGEPIFPGTWKNLVGLKKVVGNTRPQPITGQAGNYRLDGTRFKCITSGCEITYAWDGIFQDGYSTNFLSPRNPSSVDVPAYFGIDGVTTGYDTPFLSYDVPQANGSPSRSSRRIVDFPQLDGASPISANLPNIIDTGRTLTSEQLTQGNVSRYQNETVRINLDVSRIARGRLVFIGQGGQP